jgi:hypothetical protein
VYFDLIKRIPHNPADKPDFRSPDFDLTVSVVGSQAHALLSGRSKHAEHLSISAFCSTICMQPGLRVGFPELRHQGHRKQRCGDHRVNFPQDIVT